MLTRRRTLLLAAALAVLAVFPATAGAAQHVSWPESKLLAQINKTRTAHGLHALALDPRLTKAARAHTSAMAGSGQFAHGAFRTRMLQFGVGGPFVGENLAWGAGRFGTPSSIVAAWLASPEHRANLLRPGFRRIGLGEVNVRFNGVDGVNVVTADFAGV